jgi:hypothetical protein
LRYIGQKLKTKPIDHRLEMLTAQYAPPKPEPLGLQHMVYRRVDDAPFDTEEAARLRRTAEAHHQIMKAVELEKREAEQKQQQARAERHAAFKASPLGGLLTKRY